MKITVISIGKVGSTVAFVLARDGIADETDAIDAKETAFQVLRAKGWQ